MTFSVLSTGWAWLLVAGAVALAVAAFLVRPRPPRHRVPSLLIWARVLDGPKDRSPWDRLRWLVSLVLTAALAAILALALARPLPGSGAASGGRLLLVLDASWTMLARRPGGETRWQRAVEVAWATARSAGAREIALATTADGIVEGPTADLGLIRSALDRLRPTGAPDGAWPRLAGTAAVHFFTDGAVPRASDPEVTRHSVFAPAPNVAVTSLDVQPLPGAGQGAEAFVSFVNHAPAAQAVEFSLTRGNDVVASRTVQMRPGETRHETVPVPDAGDPRFHARVRAPANALDIDDAAAAWLWTARPLAVGVVSGSKTLPALLSADRTLRVTVVDPAAYAGARADVWVFDRWLPPTAPGQPALVIDPPASAWFGARGAAETAPAWNPAGPHALLDGLDATLLRVRSARPFARATLVPVVESGRKTPLVAVDDSADGRFVILAFSTDGSNLAATPAFPVLIGNAIDWLARPETHARRRPGPIVLPASTSRVIAPNGGTLPISRRADRVTANLPGPGLFLVEAGAMQRTIVVGLGDAERTDLQSSSAPADTTPRAPGAGVPRPWWTLLGIAALVLAIGEWLAWQRRVTV